MRPGTAKRKAKDAGLGVDEGIRERVGVREGDDDSDGHGDGDGVAVTVTLETGSVELEGGSGV